MLRCLLFVLYLVFVQLPLSAQIPVPTAAQRTWHDTEFYLFCHFGPNTFTNIEWGHGTEPEDVFNPTGLDCDQWCHIARQAGARGIVITAKHHDGFCLWPSKYSTHTVRESKWRAGKGDVLRELSEACRRHGLKFGIYLSPWDRNHPQYGTTEYNDLYVNTLTELMTQYGDLFEFWWDGANGEGPNGKKQEYDFRRFEQTAARLQPNAILFSDIGPGCRWVGNERGVIESETNWCTLDTAGFRRGAGSPPMDTLNQGNFNGKNWIPAECDVSIRPGWFYHAEEDDKVKSPDQLWNIYLHSVGRGANLILNVPPDRQGRFAPPDSATLIIFGKKLRSAFRDNLAWKKVCYADEESKIRVCDLTDGNRNTGSGFSINKGVVVNLKRKQTFNAVLLRELITESQRIASFKVEVLEEDGWREVARSATIGARKILPFPTVKARKLRITVLSAKGAPMLSEIEVYKF